ncbi:hypothetical protein K504DRAFT_417405 [Pleomassaria siparia CBS 279.74]|uniref:Zn(2)-C6 fungal-type domain-containing protein n=1 Tax=Pleomassaria siparia CBS 279.74 TaxID=1314801 RepID=A0A6G1JUH0_9PLEO|nr:hypothetical protein K504DRAFT_417405 [Pleomassaria siparia CBS 279.74]
MPPLGQEKTTASSTSTTKKTKSRNGCGRCKLKRLKCDETSPSCLQCRKRNIACPGYEKTLKWSTKYELLQPIHFGSPPEPTLQPDINQGPPLASDITLSPEVVSGFEALAAVLPTRKKRAETNPTVPARHDSPIDVVADSISNATGVDITVEEAPVEVDQTGSNFPTVDEELNDLDALLYDDMLEVINAQYEAFNDDDAPIDFPNLAPLIDLDVDEEEVQRPPEDKSLSLGPTTSRLSRSLLLDYYRFPSPSPTTSSLRDVESMLVQHYFKDVCVLFSSFDSLLNPFRTTIGRIFQESPSGTESGIFYAIQSMAAAHLANSFPDMATVGMEMQRKSCESLQEELALVKADTGQTSCARTFLTIILLGMTTSWHESSALGEDYLSTARSLILPKLLSSSEDEQVQRETQFFEESLIYWEMLIGFVTQDTFDFSSGPRLRSRAIPQKPALVARKPDGKIVPHPWTGIAPTIQILFAEVGRLIRRERMLDMHGAVDLQRRQDNLLNAATLEEDLLEAEFPMADELADAGDARTSRDHFVVIAEAYRCAGLLELYRVFPSILRKRLGTDKFTWTDSNFEFPTPRFNTSYEDNDTKLWINSLALHILKTLETLPTSSGTLCIQPILLLAAASELKLVSSLDFFDMHANDTKVLRARAFAHMRLQECALRLPAKPMRKILELVKEVWRRLDGDGGRDAFWLDVMVEKGWHTLMG